jgi:hypothetical protein
MLKSFVSKEQSDWDDHLPYVMAAYRSTQQSSTGCSPNLLMLGREDDSPIDRMMGPPPGQSETECPIEYVEWVKHALRQSYSFAYNNLRISASRQKCYYDLGLKPRQFSEGNWVWRWYPPTANQKLGQGWTDPYLVLAKITNLKYKIQISEDSRSIIVHVDHLKPWERNSC